MNTIDSKLQKGYTVYNLTVSHVKTLTHRVLDGRGKDVTVPRKKWVIERKLLHVARKIITKNLNM